MRYRTPTQIRADLERIGVDPEMARALSAAGKVKAVELFGPAAEKFAKDHEHDVTLTVAQQHALLRLVIPQYEADAKLLVRVPLNQNEFDAPVSFDYARGPGNFRKSQTCWIEETGSGRLTGSSTLTISEDEDLDYGERQKLN